MKMRTKILLVLILVVPTIISTFYYSIIASSAYLSESRFIVRSPQRMGQTGLGALLQGTALSRSQDDSFAVHDFMRSRDAITELNSKIDLIKNYSDPKIDFFNRFAGIDWDDSFEAFHKYYQRQIGIDYDPVSSITVLRVRAFSAEEAKAINELLLEMGERLVNNMNLRSRKDLIDVAERELRSAEIRAKTSAQALSRFRGERGVLDPERQGANQLLGIEKLRDELLANETQMEILRKVSPANPQIIALETRITVLKRAIASERSRVLSKETGLSTKAAAYDGLQLEKSFAERQLASALAALDSARSEASRKQLYLERLVQPNLPDSADEPRRLKGIITTFLMGLIVFGILSLILSSVREHFD